MPLFGAVGVGHVYRMPAMKFKERKEKKKKAARGTLKHLLTCPEFIILFFFVSSLEVHMFIFK